MADSGLLMNIRWITAFCVLLAPGWSAASDADDLGTGDTRYELDFGARARSYLVHVPDGVKKPAPLVISLHGGGGNARANAQQTGFDAEADRSGFIVVHPNGTGQSRPLLNALGKGFFFTWNAGTCCGYARDNNIDDVGFLLAMIAAIRVKYPIDSRRIYASGISNGGMMSYRLACEASDLIAAIGVVSGAQTAANCRPSHPVSVIHIHGSADQNVLMAGGVGPKGFDKQAKPPVMDAINFWAHEDGARAPQTRSSGKLRMDDYKGKNGAEVLFILIAGGGHSWPGGDRMLAALDPPSTELSATPVIWQFFATHLKP